MATLTAHKLKGAPRELYLPDNIRLITQLVRHPNVGNGVVRKPKTSDTFHDTGNPRTTAAGEMKWLADGRPGGSAGGYSFIVGTRVAYYCGQLDLETWHAGVQAGNWYSIGVEHAFGGSEDWQGSLDTACWLHAAILECFNLPMSVFYWHQKWYGKFCPGQVFNRGLQSWVIAKVSELRTRIRAHRNGTVAPAPVQEWADPILPVMTDGKPWDGQKDLIIKGTKFEAQRVKVKAVSDVRRRQWANTTSLFTGPDWRAGAEDTILGWVKGQVVDGVSEWAIDKHGGRVWAGALDFTPKTDPDWAIVPTDKAPGVAIVNGRLYYPLLDEDTGALGRKITVHRAGSLYKWGTTKSPIVGKALGEEERVFRYWTRGEELPLTTVGGKEVVESIWYAEALHAGARMWSGLTEERPQ